jgi:amino acid adenylation domain-containing protein
VTPELLHDYLSATAERQADRQAVVLDEHGLTYGELESSSNRLARLLVDAGCAPGDRVCLFIPKSPAAILAMHAVVKARCIYVPIDAGSPPARVAKVLQSADPSLILATASTHLLVDEVLALASLRPPVGSLDDDPIEGDHFESRFSLRDAQALPLDPPKDRGQSSDVAHLLFTSGSTGVPKGVAITHRNVIAFIEWARSYFGIGPNDRLSGHSPLHFDLSTFDIYGALSSGAELHLVPPELNLLSHQLAAFIGKARLTQWFSVPSAMSLIAKSDAIPPESFADLRRVLWCGEVLPTSTLMYWMDRVPHATYTNLYGPTEATIASSYHTVEHRPEDEIEAIPIGEPCSGEELLVLDDALQPVAPGEIGSLYLAGVGLSPGYWRDDEKTRAVFVDDPRSGPGGGRIYSTGDLARVSDDGLVYFLGRKDSQVKSRGHRIELGEIEAALSAITALRESAAVAVATDGFEGTVICCAYAPVDPGNISASELKRELRTNLPSYMLPSRWLELETLPKNQNGKIDRPRLRTLFEEQVAR